MVALVGKVLELFRSLISSGDTPHFVKFEEVARIAHPTRNQDAVLAKVSGDNYKLYVVQTGKPLYGQSSVVTLVHCEGITPTIRWVNELTIECVHSCRTLIENEEGVTEPTEFGTMIRLG